MTRFALLWLGGLEAVDRRPPSSVENRHHSKCNRCCCYKKKKHPKNSRFVLLPEYHSISASAITHWDRRTLFGQMASCPFSVLFRNFRVDVD
uniref:Uncharacterized protein n=1 Tax=Scophthalmus maximus TaxID=52904 RepID=A0A8D3CVT9_SCOMX